MKSRSTMPPRVVIVGAGFAGLEAAKILARAKGSPVDVTVIDRRNHHLFQPLLYQVATAGLSPADIAVPVRSVLRGAPRTDVLMASVERIDPAARQLRLDHDDVLTYDYLILATGATHSYFNHPEWEPLAPGLKTIEDATEIRGRILNAFEAAERAHTAEEREALLTFVVIGAGPTGIEVAGAIAELARFALAKDFDHINPTLAKIVLIEAGPRVLAAFGPEVAAEALPQLKRLGVHVRLGQRVTGVTAAGVTIEGKEHLPARTVIWAAGVKPSPLAKDLGVPLDFQGRVLVGPDLSVPGHPEVFVCGDLAAVKWTDSSWVPGMAPGAMQGGRHAARTILGRLSGAPGAPFRYKHKGSMATIGRAAAVVEMDRLRLHGFVAWIVWLTVHIFYLIGFRNRVLVLLEWAWSYLAFQRGARLITTPPRRGPPS